MLQSKRANPGAVDSTFAAHDGFKGKRNGQDLQDERVIKMIGADRKPCPCIKMEAKYQEAMTTGPGHSGPSLAGSPSARV